jgi:hypothetical protein
VTAPRKKFRLPFDATLAGEIRAAFKELSAEAVDEVLNVLDQMSRFGADADDRLAVFNGHYEVLSHEVPGGVFVLLVRDTDDDEWMLADVSLKAPQAQRAAERCARAVGVAIQSLHIGS